MNNIKHTDNINILIVDDDPMIANLLTRWLTDEGFCSDRAVNAHEAITKLRQKQFDLVTLDIRMPETSGLELLKQVKHEFPDIAALMLTGEGDTSTAVEALTSGAFGYLQKPVDQEELVVQIDNALNYRRMVIENRLYTEGLAKKVREQTATILAAHEETVHRLIRASLYHDEETGAHIRRVGEFSRRLALQAGWSSEASELIRLASPLHDVGKIGIPDAILRKAGRLNAEEMTVMRTHTIIGARMLAGSKLPMMQMAEEIALNHHEQWSGGGYPNKIAGHSIPESARIVAIVDVYDALSHDRVYRPAMSEEIVLTILRNGYGRHFDPLLLEAFFTILPEIRSVNATILEGPEDHNSCTPEPALV